MRLETAAWDAYTLSVVGSKNPETGDKIAVWRAYVGPDYSEQQDRMIGKYSNTIPTFERPSFPIALSTNCLVL
jgi:hypothetical protein